MSTDQKNTKQPDASAHKAAAQPTQDLAHMREILESVDSVIWEFNADDFTTIYVSPQIERILGYTHAEATADVDLWKKIVHPDDLAEVLDECSEHTPPRDRYDFEYRICTAAGQYRWVRDVTTLIRVDGKPARFRCVLTDITDRHAAQEELERSRERLSEAQRIARLGDWAWDIPNDEVTWSDECFRIFGLEPQSVELSFDSFQNLLDPSSAEVIENALGRTFEHGSAYVIEHPIMRPDGTTVIVRSFGELVRDDDDEPVCLRGTIQDVTERYELEQLKDELIALVSHELRTPLTPLVGLLSLLSSDQELQAIPRLARMVDLANKNVGRLAEVVEALLEVRQLTAEPEKSLRFEIVDLSDVVVDALDAHDELAESHSITVAPAEEPLLVCADEERLVEVFTSLLDNAAKFSADGTAIEIRMSRVEERARVQIRDHGEGIPAHFQGRIFEPFAQADGPISRSYGGIGLGLAIAKAIVDRHEGRIGFESPAGGGTLVFVELPLAGASAPSG